MISTFNDAILFLLSPTFFIQVACGLYHTACVTASGVAITWGGNESGQVRARWIGGRGLTYFVHGGVGDGGVMARIRMPR